MSIFSAFKTPHTYFLDGLGLKSATFLFAYPRLSRTQNVSFLPWATFLKHWLPPAMYYRYLSPGPLTDPNSMVAATSLVLLLSRQQKIHKDYPNKSIVRTNEILWVKICFNDKDLV